MQRRKKRSVAGGPRAAARFLNTILEFVDSNVLRPAQGPRGATAAPRGGNLRSWLNPQYRRARVISANSSAGVVFFQLFRSLFWKIVPFC